MITLAEVQMTHREILLFVVSLAGPPRRPAGPLVPRAAGPRRVAIPSITITRLHLPQYQQFFVNIKTIMAFTFFINKIFHD